MKKTLVALAALAAVGAASAQSSVTLYGRLDGSVGKTEHKVTGATFTGTDAGMNVSPGVMSGSRWGMRGTEDLGGGMSAFFTLEGGITQDTGGNAQGGLPFGRTAELGLKGGFGTVTLGRSYSLNVQIANSGWNVGAYGNYNAWYAGANFGNGTAAGGSVDGDLIRVNNAVTYTTPAMGGLSGMVQWAPGENGTAAGASASSLVALGVNWGAGPLGIGFVHETKNAAAGAADTKAWNMGVNYDLGVAKLGVSLVRAKVDAGSKDSGWGLNVGIPIGAMSLAVEYAKETTKTAASAFVSNAKAWDIRLTYPLSKRTYMYGRLQNGKALVASGDTSKLSAYSVGLVHSF